jgi:hypothetical protein
MQFFVSLCRMQKTALRFQLTTGVVDCFVPKI